jgi:hypothetical protein
VKFSESSLNHVGWAAGTLTLAKATYSAPSGKDPSVKDVTWGTSIFNIALGSYPAALSSGNTYYAYVTYTVDAVFSEPSGAGTVQIVSTYPTGQYDIVLAVIRCTATGHLEVEPVNATGTIINGDHIITGSIDALKLNVTDLSAISANIGTITTGFIGNLSGSYFDVTNGIICLRGGKVSLDAGAISTSQLSNNLGWTNDATANAAQSTANAAATAATNAANAAYAAQLAANSKVAAADVANAINNNVTTINGAKITTGTIIASQIQLYGINTSQLNNNAGWTNDAAANNALSIANSKITQYDVQNAIINNVTSISGAKIVTGSLACSAIAVGTLTGFTINAAVFNGGHFYGTFLGEGVECSYIDTGTITATKINIGTYGTGIYWGSNYLGVSGGHLYFNGLLVK